jgi:hypothetical protein
MPPLRPDVARRRPLPSILLLLVACSGSGSGSGSGGPGAPPPPVDTTPPAAPVLSTPAGKTNDNTPRLAGSAAPRATVRAWAGTLLLGSGTAAADGSWTLHPSVALPDGPHALHATAANAAGESGPSDPVSIEIDTVPPAAPAGLSVRAYSGMAGLSWDANAEADLRGYHVYRRGPSDADFVRITPKVVTEPCYRDTGLTDGQAYRYKVTAVDDARNERHP